MSEPPATYRINPWFASRPETQQMTEIATIEPTAVAPIDQSALARLREKARIETTVVVWKPEPGEILEGVIAGSRRVQGPFGDQAQALIQTPKGNVVAVWLTAWLLGQLRANSAEIGDLISLTFVGKEIGGRGQAFNRMSLTILKA